MEINSQNSSTWSDVSDKRLDNLISQPDHYEIKGFLNQSVGDNTSSSKIKVEGSEKSPNILQRAYRAASRTQTQKDAYRNGIENVRELLREKYDQNAVKRFDNHFSYRRWAGKPLTVRAFKVFIEKEEELRQGSMNVSTEKQGVEKLEDLKEKLSADDQQDYRIIGGDKVPSADKTDYWFPFLPIKRSWFEFSANAEDEKKGREAGIDEAKKALLDLIPKEKETTRKHIEHLFNARFAAKIQSKESLTVSELAVFIDDAIKIRSHENGICGVVYQVATSARDQEGDIAAAICNFLKGAYHAVGVAAGAAIVLDQERNTNDPIMGLAKGIAAGTLVANETDTEKILTAVTEHLIATSEAPASSWTSSVLRFFTFGIY